MRGKALDEQNSQVEAKRGNTGRSSLAQTKGLLRHLNVRATKGLGQHFLVNTDVLDTIITAAELDPADTVVEVGPGLGILTEKLIDRAGRVIAVEIDAKLAEALGLTFADALRLTVIHADILDLAPGELLKVVKPDTGQSLTYKVIGNLPYYIALPILRHFLEASLKPRLMVVTVQKEVGQSMVAEPGNMSMLGIGVQLYGKPTIVDYVSAASFHPRPKVDSAIVRIEVYPKPFVAVADISLFFEVAKAWFSSRRKQLRNALSVGLHLPPEETGRLLERAHIEPQRRPQTLSLQEWARVYEAFEGRDKA